jgi:hypothetical protein
MRLYKVVVEAAVIYHTKMIVSSSISCRVSETGAYALFPLAPAEVYQQ